MALDTLTGATTPDPEDDTETYDPGALGLLQKQFSVMREREIANRNKSWDAIAQTLEKSRPSKSEMWFSLASALAQPTKTGSFGETLGNVSDTLGESRKAQREFDTTIAKNQFERDQDLSELGSKYDLKSLDLQGKMASAGRTTFIPGDGGQWKKTPGQPLEWIPVAGAPTKVETWSKATQDGVRGQISNRGEFKAADRTIEEEAARAGQIDLAKNSAIARADLPKAKLFAENALGIVEKLRNHPGLSAVIGMPNPLKGGFGFAQIPSSEAADFNSLLEQATGNTFLQAYDILRGTGSIATVEGSKGESAIARMQKAQSEKAFNEALDDYVDFLKKGLAAKEELAGMGGGSSSGSKSLTRPAPKSAPKGELPPLNSFYKK